MAIFNNAISKFTEKGKRYLDRKDVISELDEIKTWIDGIPEEKIWAFSSGHDGESFRGNPKFLFAYINNYRKDIRAYWLCNNEETIAQVRSLGFHAYSQKSLEGTYLIERTGVNVAEQIRINMPFGKNTKYLNLWHGNGYKKCERSRIDDSDDLRLELAEKYIKHNAYYMNNMITCCNSSLQEKYFYRDQGITKRQVLPAGYPRCIYQKKYSPIKTFNHNIRETKGLNSDAKLVVYAPTFREHRGDTFTTAISDLEKLYSVCEKNNILLIFKVHPFMEKEVGFVSSMEKYKDKKHFLFWDNRDDFYEIMHEMDLVIYDYSSMFSDFLLSGVRKYIRYLFDKDTDYCSNIMDEDAYYKNTCGTICENFEDLVNLLDSNVEDEDEELVSEILHSQWEYSGDDDCEKIVNYTLDFEIGHEEFPTLYSYDIFDTLIARKGHEPRSIFYDVQRKMRESGAFDNQYIVNHYPYLRESAALSVREYMDKSTEQRGTFKTEITLKQIIDHLKRTLDITDEQCELLTKFEIESEIDAVIPISETINQLKEQISNGETVILVSDMYLPLEVIKEMLRKADPMLAEIPIFLSNEYGVLKVSGLLFFEVYRSFIPYYNFGKWIHTGDNINADQKAPRKLGIRTRKIPLRKFSNIEEEFCDYTKTYEGYIVANLMNKLAGEYDFDKGRFVSDYVAPMLVSYIDYVLRDAISKKFETLYFVSRDGYFLKKIADALIKENDFNLKTKYIYASRRTWRLASFIDKVDDEFFAAAGGNFSDIKNKTKFIRAAEFDSEEEFHKVLPHINLDEIDFSEWTEDPLQQPSRILAQTLKNSEEYVNYIFERGKKKRELASKYLLQEINKDEKFAFVEFWGRGYNQVSHSKIWNNAIGREDITYYYYCRSLFGSEGNCVRYNMTSLDNSLFFMESIFANMPYKSIDTYQEVNGRVEPVIEGVSYDEDLYNTMETILPIFAKEYANLGLHNYVETDKAVFDFLLAYYRNNEDDPFIYNNFGHLVDAVGIHGEKRQFARPYTHEDIEDMKKGTTRIFNTTSTTISYYRSEPKVKKEFDELFQLQKGDSPKENIRLKPEQIEKNRSFKSKCDGLKKTSHSFQSKYNNACKKNKVGNNIVLVSTGSSLGEMLSIVKSSIEKNATYSLQIVCKNEVTNFYNIATLFSKAKFIIINGNIEYLSNVEIRTQTKLILLTDPSIRIMRRGYNAINFLVWEKKYKELSHDIRLNVYDAPSKYVGDELVHAFDGNPYALTCIEGSVITDLYFDEDFRKASIELIDVKYPELKDKKVIFYKLDAKPASSDLGYELINMSRLQKCLGDDYYVIIDMRNRHEHLSIYKSLLEIDGFSKIVDNDISVRSLLIYADIIIANYVDELFESAILEKPTYFIGHNFEQKIIDNNVKFELFDDLPFPIVNTADDIALAIKDADNYDYELIKKFKNKYLSYCDGKSLRRLIEFINND